MIGWQALFVKARSYERQGEWHKATKLYETLTATGESSNPKILFRLGHAQFQQNNLLAAQENIDKAVQLSPVQATWHYRLGSIYERTRQYSKAIDSYRNALAISPENPEWHYRLGKALLATHETELGTNALWQALKRNPKEARYQEAYKKFALASVPAWQQISIYKELDSLDINSPKDKQSIADAHMELGQFREAAINYEAYLQVNPEHGLTHYKLGRALDELNSTAKSNRHLNLSMTLAHNSDASRYGPGVYAEAKGDWRVASAYYAMTAERQPFDADLHYKLGLALDRIYHWEESQTALERAIQLDPTRPGWHYRLAFVLERQEKWRDAADSYRYAVETNKKHVAYWHYRLGVTLKRSGEYRDAAEAFLRMNPGDHSIKDIQANATLAVADAYQCRLFTQAVRLAIESQDSENCYKKHSLMAKHGYWELAADAISAAIARSADHRSDWHRELGSALCILNRYEDACEALMRQRIFQRPDGIDANRYFKKTAQRETLEHIEYRESLPIQYNTILYESHFGASVDCNPLALCEAALEDERFSDYTHIWVANDPSHIPNTLRARTNVIFVPRKSDAYRRYLATAEYLVNNVTFPSYFTRRDEQKYLNTWHGTPMKTLGIDIKTGFMEHANVTRNFLQATHLITANEHTASTLIDRYDIDGLTEATLIKSGTPRIDRTINSSDEYRSRLKEKLGISPESTRPVVLYAPTWRGSLTTKHFDAQRLISDISELQRLDVDLIFRAHHMTEKLVTNKLPEEIIAPREIDTNDLLSVVDVLITDYSSICFDFLPLKRKIVFYNYDLDEYEEERGLYLSPEELPGNSCPTIESVCGEIQASIDTADFRPDARFLACLERFCPKETGNASLAALEQFTGLSSPAYPKDSIDSKRTLLFHQSLLPNGITSSFINLLEMLDSEQFRVVFVFDPQSLVKDESRYQNFLKLPSYVQKIARIGSMVFTLEEKWVSEKANIYGSLGNSESKALYHSAFNREFRRIFGETVFDSVIEYDGYAPFWLGLVSSARLSSTRVCYLHNNMHEEWMTKYPYLSLSFEIMSEYDALVSVSSATNVLNRTQLSERWDIPSRLFDYSDNPVDAGAILRDADEPIDADIADWLGDADDVFVNIGRLSPEKDHAKLIEAFSRVIATNADVKLVILGAGPLRNYLEELITSLGVGRNILLAGRRSNPFSLIARSRTFILSSNHEGQPMVLLEAMVLGVDIIATDIPANEGVVELGYGTLVDNCTDGLVGAILDNLGSPPSRHSFDIDNYLTNSLKLFLNIVSPRTDKYISNWDSLQNSLV